MFPIKAKYRKGYEHSQKTFYNASHLGIDLIVPSGTAIYMPKDGRVIRHAYGPQGGNRIEVQINGDIHRFLHLQKAIALPGIYKEGTLIALSGNTGAATTGPHIHWDIKRGNTYIDPMAISWDNDDMELEQRIEELERKDREERVPQIKRLQAEVRKLTAEVIKYKDAYERVDAEYKKKEAEVFELTGQVKKWKDQYDMCNKKKLEDLTLLEKIRALLT